MKTSTFQIADLKEISEFINLYSEQSIDDLTLSIQQNGQQVPIQITPEGHIIDGYRRVQALRTIGNSSVEVIISQKTKPTIYDRIQLNIQRQKTLSDQIMETKFIYQKFPNRQGLKLPNGKKYKRHKLISDGLNNRFKGDKVIRKLESVINKDFPNDLMLKGILDKGWKVESCYDFLNKNHKKDIDGKYGFTQRLIDGGISVADANKLINQMENIKIGSDNFTFKIPQRGSVYNMNCLDLVKIDEHLTSVDLIFTSPPYYNLRKYENDDPNQLGHEKTPKEYCENVSKIFNSLVPVLKRSANVMINIGETYQDGVGCGIQYLLKQAIEENTPLIYKDTLIWSKTNPKPQNETVRRPINNLEYILWFLVDPKESKYHKLTYPVKNKVPKLTKGVRDIDEFGNVYGNNLSISKPYGKIYSHIQEQEVENIIKCSVGQNHEVYKIASEGHPAIMNSLLPIVPILMTTDESDYVLDPFAGSNVVGRMSQLLNRQSISCELSNKYHKIGCEMLRKGVEGYSHEDLSVVQNLAYKQLPLSQAA